MSWPGIHTALYILAAPVRPHFTLVLLLLSTARQQQAHGGAARQRPVKDASLALVPLLCPLLPLLLALVA
jgi:hypothetical protein